MANERDEITSGGETEWLPRELDGIQREVAADGAAWARGVPAVDRLHARLRVALVDVDVDVPGATGANGAERTLRTVERDDTTEGTPVGRVPGGRVGGRMSQIAGLVAAVVVVGLLAGVFASLSGRGGTSVGHPGTATPGPQPQVYHNQPGLPVVAPSDPQVVYEYADNLPGPVLRRSDDGGATWRDLAIPGMQGASFVSALHLGVNPADAANVFLRVDLGYQIGGQNACPDPHPIKSTICTTEYYSTDRGADWNALRLPAAGTLFESGVIFYYPWWILHAQGSRLYAGMQNGGTLQDPALDIRIASTTDGGESWTLADADLVAAGRHVCDFVAAPAGETLFARTATVCQSSDPGTQPTPRRLWRSDDAGVHWTVVTPAEGVITSPDATLRAVAGGGPAGAPTLYASLLDVTSARVYSFYASRDGGQTWVEAPADGLPAGASALQAAPTTLGDGSLVVAFSGTGVESVPGTPTLAPGAGAPPPTATPTPASPQDAANGSALVSCYTWRPGQARWERLTQPVPMSQGTPNVFVADGTERVVTLTAAEDNSSSPTFAILRFA